MPDPVPAPDQVLVEVAHSSLNFGEVFRAKSAEAAGEVFGWDASGVVVAAAADGSGPAVGSRVLTFDYGGGWARRRAVAANEVAVVPEGVDLAVASTLPVAGVTALRALRNSGSLLGKRVLITGASGGVGRFAVQLAARAGAHVIANAARGAGLAELGAHEVVASLDDLEPVDVVLDNVGGSHLVRVHELLTTDGVIQSIGWTSGEPAVFPPYSTVALGKRLVGFQAGTGFAPDLAYLLDLLGRGALSVEVGWRGSWEKFDEAAEALLGRKVSGKAVIDLD
ncbi:zinc-binding dehydrogenase [Amycolatopsis anabasis]|uniref:zinc-binding dehydrogenase n=1 Tax=Amycolatopsis anabasis TaxID=1840409 RepID=UPI001FE34784|nr:zinc-binding dehydrogenase [Amycolatopsis anabasis]